MLSSKEKYLQIALNSTLSEANQIINQIPVNHRIILEAGTPLIKQYGARAISGIKTWYQSRVNGQNSVKQNASAKKKGFIKTLMKDSQSPLPEIREIKPDFNKRPEPYIVADLKCMDRGRREVAIAKTAGATAAVVLGHAPVETINAFIENCRQAGIDAFIDMMNVGFPLEILRQLKVPPKVVMIHRGVDEENFNKEKEIPFHEIVRIKNEFDIMVAIAGGDEFHEIENAVFNDADIVVIWKSVFKSTADTAKNVEEFLKEIR